MAVRKIKRVIKETSKVVEEVPVEVKRSLVVGRFRGVVAGLIVLVLLGLFWWRWGR